MSDGMPGEATVDGQTLPTGSAAAAPGARPLPQLFVLARRDAIDAPGSRHRLDGLAEVRLGRGEGGVERDRRRLALRLPDRRLSARHARLVRRDDGWHLEDRGSTNGTRLDGQPVTAARLSDGALIELGRSLLLFRDRAPVAPTTPLDVAEGALPEVAPGWRTFHDPLAADWRRLSRTAGRARVLIRGPTGSGKEVAARTLHALSGRPGPFVAVNCAGLPPDLIAAELFGHRAGAFSGAREARPGYLRAAHGGTLLLDEVDSLPPAAQAALLRPLAEGAVSPVGAERAAPFDTWVLAASNCDLEAAVERGAFRVDLMARLAEQTLHLPPLAERREDLGLLVRRLWPGRPLRLERGAGRAIFGGGWARNVRGLESALRVGCAAARDGVLRACDLPEPGGGGAAAVDPERASLIAALRAEGGNARAAAARLGVARSTFYRRLERLGIDPAAYR